MHVDRAPGLVAGMADIFQWTLDTIWLAGETQFTPVPDDLVREQNPAVPGNDLHQSLLDLLGLALLCQFQPA